MAVTAHAFPSLTQSMGTKLFSLNNVDTLKVGLASGTFNWPGTGNSTAGYTTVAQFLANAGSGGGGALTEEAGAGYSRQSLTSVTFTTTGLVNTLTCANPSWTGATFSDKYAFFYDAAVDTNDTTRLLMCYWDFGGTQSTTAATFTLTISGSGLVTWTSS